MMSKDSSDPSIYDANQRTTGHVTSDRRSFEGVRTKGRKEEI